MTLYNLNQWVQIDDHLIRVEEMKMETLRIGRDAEKTGTVRFLVAYKNQTQGTLKHTGRQWLLYDTDGFVYDNEIVFAYFGDDATRKLQEGRINPGRQVKGWVAFKVPPDVTLDYVQFRADFMTANTARKRPEPMISPYPFARFYWLKPVISVLMMWLTLKFQPCGGTGYSGFSKIMFVSKP